MRMNSWKTAVAATLLSLAAHPVLASDAASDTQNPTAVRVASADPQPQAQVNRLGERVSNLEKRVDQLDGSRAAPAPSAADLKQQKREEENQAQFLNQIWTAP